MDNTYSKQNSNNDDEDYDDDDVDDDDKGKRLYCKEVTARPAAKLWLDTLTVYANVYTDMYTLFNLYYHCIIHYVLSDVYNTTWSGHSHCVQLHESA